MTYVTERPTAATSTCADCPCFQDYHEKRGRGWCKAFDQGVRTHHQVTNDCVQVIEKQRLEELLRQHQAFLKPLSTLPSDRSRDVYRRDIKNLGFDHIGHINQDISGMWFATKQGGLTVAEAETQHEVLAVLLHRA